MQCNQTNLARFTEADFVLVLIREDLKSNRFFSTLRSINIDDEFFQTDFSPTVLLALDIPNEDHWNETYGCLIDKHSRLADLDNDSFCKHAVMVYRELEKLRSIGN